MFAGRRNAWEDGSGQGLGSSVVIARVLSGIRPDIDALRPDTPHAIRTLIQRCWEQNPDARPIAVVIAQKLRHALHPLALTHTMARTQHGSGLQDLLRDLDFTTTVDTRVMRAAVASARGAAGGVGDVERHPIRVSTSGVFATSGRQPTAHGLLSGGGTVGPLARIEVSSRLGRSLFAIPLNWQHDAIL